MLFTWDPAKAGENYRKHRVSFEIARSVFDDPLHLSILDSKIHHEERWITMGRAANSQTLVVVHTYRIIGKSTEITRIISARKATRKEKNQYEKGI